MNDELLANCLSSFSSSFRVPSSALSSEVSHKWSVQRSAKPLGEIPYAFESHRLRSRTRSSAESERSPAEAEVARSSRAGFIRFFRDRPTGRTPDFGSGDVGSNPSPGVVFVFNFPDVA